jgi:translation initiation factor 2-alpha kinase 4
MDVVAVGGRYDSLIARFVPPNSTQTPISAVGMNVAIEKIIASTIALYTANQETRALNRRLRARELMRGVHVAGEQSRSSVLLYCTRGSMLYERAGVANSLWEDGIPARMLYCVPIQTSAVPFLYFLELSLSRFL